jgi:hypothetical protein
MQADELTPSLPTPIRTNILKQAILRLEALSPLLRGPETGRIETIRVLLRVILEAAYAVTGRDARGPGCFACRRRRQRVWRKNTPTVRYLSRHNTNRRKGFLRETGQVGGTKRERVSDLDDERLCRRTTRVVGRFPHTEFT